MLNYSQIDTDQLALIDRIYEHDTNFIYAGMGAGKTVCALTAVSELLRDGEVSRVLIVAPLRPAREVWSQEHKKWRHLSALDVAVACGTPKQRLAAINSNAPIVVINIENLVWFFNAFKRAHNFDCLVIDELSKFGDNSAKSVKKLRTYTDSFKHCTGLTASPTHEGFDRLFAQVAVLDGGARFGRSKANFLSDYFWATDYEQRNWELRPNMQKRIMAKIADIFYAMPDYTHTLPPLHEHVETFELDDETRAHYDEFKRHSVITIDELDIVAENMAVQSGKLEQITSSFVYCDEDVITLSDTLARKNAFASLRAREGANRALIFYSFEEEKAQIISALRGNYRLITDANAVDDWNNGKVQNLVLHPKSASHGLNLAQGGHTVICYSPIWSNDAFKQLIARVWRRGQAHEVNVYTLVCLDSVDLIKSDRIEGKEEYDRLLNAYLKEGRV